VLVPGDSLLTRIIRLENLSQDLETFPAGSTGIQSGKIVALVNNVLEHADARNITHAGNIVGLSVEARSANELVKVQNIGKLVSVYNFGIQAPVIVGKNGNPAYGVDSDFVFVQYIGIASPPDTLIIQNDNTAYIL